MAIFDLLSQLELIRGIYQVLTQFNLQGVFSDILVFVFEILIYVPALLFNQLYTFFSSVYAVLYGMVSFVVGLGAIVDLLKSGFWPASMPVTMTYLMFLSIGIANSRLIFNIVLRIYRLIPIVGGR